MMFRLKGKIKRPGGGAIEVMMEVEDAVERKAPEWSGGEDVPDEMRRRMDVGTFRAAVDGYARRQGWRPPEWETHGALSPLEG